jgi:hypothetical protein
VVIVAARSVRMPAASLAAEGTFRRPAWPRGGRVPCADHL